MLRLAIREVFRRRLRAFLLALTVIVAGSFMVAILILGDSLVAGLQTANVDEAAFFGGEDGINSIRNILLFFDFLALLVGIFVIANTFWVILSQRAYELALLRVIGASRGQIFAAVIWEAWLVGVLGGVVSILCGIGLAQGFFSLSDALDWEVAHAGLRFSPWVFILPMMLATLITTAAAILPAIIASRRSPLASLTAVYGLVKNKHRLLLILGLVLAALGGLLQALIFFSASPAISDGPLASGVQFVRLAVLWVGQSLVFIAAALLAIPFAKWIAGFFRWLLRRSRFLSWRLAVNNIWRQPARTAFTANVLMIGIVLVAVITIIASSIQLTIIELVDRTRGSDWTLQAAAAEFESEEELPDWLPVQPNLDDTNPETARITPEILRQLSAVPATGSVLGVRFAPVSHSLEPTATDRPIRSNDRPVSPDFATFGGDQLASVDGAVFARLYDQVDLSREALANLDAGQVLVSEDYLRRRQIEGWAVGGSIELVYFGPEYLSRFDFDTSYFTNGHEMPAAEPEEAAAADATQMATFVIGGTFSDFSFGSGYWPPAFLVSHEAFDDFIAGENYNIAEFDNAGNRSHGETQQDLEDFLQANQDLALSSKLEIINLINLVIRWLVNIFRALLALAIIVAIIGVLNTLVLAVSERSREIGLLRALGSSAGTMRRTLAVEAVFIATLGVALGIGLALLFAWGSIEVFINQPIAAAGESLAEAGEEEAVSILFSIPWRELSLYYAVSVVLAWLASIVPALKATRIKIIEALRSG